MAQVDAKLARDAWREKSAPRAALLFIVVVMALGLSVSRYASSGAAWTVSLVALVAAMIALGAWANGHLRRRREARDQRAITGALTSPLTSEGDHALRDRVRIDTTASEYANAESEQEEAPPPSSHASRATRAS